MNDVIRTADENAVVDARSQHYQGVKIESGDDQCTHPEQESSASWCGLDCCPLVMKCARARSLGWD